MSKAMLQRGAVRDSFTECLKKLEEELDKGELADVVLLKMLWKRGEDRFIQLEKFDNEIWDTLVEHDMSQENMNEEFNDVQEFRDKWSDISCRMDTIFKPEDSVVRSTEEPKRYKLPKLKLVEFDGSPKEWLSFWSQFKGIHGDKSLSAEEKFQYFIQATAVGSDARRVVSSFPTTAENYPKAIDHLKSRFGKDKVLIEVYVRDLLKLVLSNANGQQKMQLAKLYDELETQLLSLESLGVTTDKYAAILYPLVESALSEDVLRTWERIRNQQNEEDDVDQLQQLMQFLRKEVESDIRLNMAKRGITGAEDNWHEPTVKYRKIDCEHATVTDLLNKNRTPMCIFCERSYPSHECFAAKKMTLDKKLEKIREARNCFKCLKGNHFSRTCKAKISCDECKGNHYRLMCNQDNYQQKPLREINSVSTYVSGFIYLQILRINLVHHNKIYVVRALIDTGSERSYIRRILVQSIGCEVRGEVQIAHSLFGGHVTRLKRHSMYKVEVTRTNGTSKIQWELLDVDTICGDITNEPSEICIQELEREGIRLSDYPMIHGKIDLLIGADMASSLFTGRMYQTSEGPIAFETKLGWTLMGKSIQTPTFNNSVLLSHSFHLSNARVIDLWRLDVIGINDPVENRSRDELAKSAWEHFKEKVHRFEDGRYEVELPWIEGHQPVDNADKEFEKVTHLLKSSTYVDNCVVSVDTKEELDQFVTNSTKICAEAKFNLRNWVWNKGDAITENVSGVGSFECGLETDSVVPQETSNIVSVLGLIWNAEEDTLSLDLEKLLNQPKDVITKRSILAATHKIFDPLGFVSPDTIVRKVMLQEVFKKKYKWDEQLPEEIAKHFKDWLKEVNCLQSIRIPRWVMSINSKNKSIHVFTDASKAAYTAVAFLRSQNENGVTVQLIMSKARVSTIKPISTPKLELIGCECGAKLIGNIRDTIDMTDIKIFMWSDSSNALSWIKRNENWQIFVFNRVKKIRELAKPEDWRHIAGHLNPADLPSRGCTAKQLLASRWWEGPAWLRQSEEYLPKSSINCDEDIVMAEKKKVVVSHLVQELESHRYFQKFSQLRKVVRVIAWMRRWKNYKRNQYSKERTELTITEEQEAEICLWRMVQQENFEENKGIIKQLNGVKDQQGLWRVKTKLFMRQDYEDFKCPILLPKNHIAVRCLIRQEHLNTHHSGAPTLRSILRERFWIINL